MKRLVIAEIARADLASIRRYSTRTWVQDQTSTYTDALRDTMKGIVRVLHQRMDYRRHLNPAVVADGDD